MSYPGKDITPMKLQKLAFYAKAWTLVAGDSFIDAEFEKWDYGPVNQNIYHHYKNHGASGILAPKSHGAIEESQGKLLQFILDNYIDYSAFTLSSMTHNEAPWEETPKDKIISDALILSYYSKQPFAKNFSSNTDGVFHVLQSNAWHSFTLDMEEEEAKTFATYSSFEEFHKLGDDANLEFKKLLSDLDGMIIN